MSTLLATRNPGKLREVKEILGERIGELLTLDAFPAIGKLAEDHDTFEGNARQKAWEAATLSGVPSLADDSGLAVDALGGAPGVYSARYAGSHGDNAANRKKLLEALRDTPKEKRSARFVCVVVLADPRTNTEILVRESCEGEIGFEERGQKGFGYDPLFLVPNTQKTMAELEPDEKNAISHRGKALRALLEKLIATDWRA